MSKYKVGDLVYVPRKLDEPWWFSSLDRFVKRVARINYVGDWCSLCIIDDDGFPAVWVFPPHVFRKATKKEIRVYKLLRDVHET